MVTEDLKNLSNKELKDIYWLIFKVRKLTGKNKEREIIRNHLLLDKLLKLDKLIEENPDKEEYKREAKIIENMLLKNMKNKLKNERSF